MSVTKQKFAEQFFQKLLEHGIEKAQIYIQDTSKAVVSVYQQELDNFYVSEQYLLFVEAKVGEYRGYVFVENLDPACFESYIRTIMETANAEQKPYTENKLQNTDSKAGYSKNVFDTDAMIEKLLRAEKAALAFDKRITAITACRAESTQKMITLLDISGEKMVDCTHYASFDIGLTAKEGTLVQTANNFAMALDWQEIDCEKVAAETAKEAIAMLHTIDIATDNYTVLLQNNAAASLIAGMCSMFTGDVIAAGVSPLNSAMLGNKIAANCVTITDNPRFSQARDRREFDDEGTPTSAKDIVKDGIYTAILHSKHSASDKSSSTGNGFKKSYKESVSSSVSNLVVQAQDNCFEELIAQMGTGVCITDIQGSFGGINAITGDFSVLSCGFYVENGKIQHALDQITVAGNFLTLLQSVTAIGNDYAPTASYADFVCSPSLLVNKLSITGK